LRQSGIDEELFDVISGFEALTGARRHARSDVDRRTPGVAAQPELGILPERWPRLGSGHSGGPAFHGQDFE